MGKPADQKKQNQRKLDDRSQGNLNFFSPALQRGIFLYLGSFQFLIKTIPEKIPGIVSYL